MDQLDDALRVRNIATHLNWQRVDRRAAAALTPVNLRNAVIVQAFGGVPGLDGPGDRRQFLELGVAVGITQIIRCVLPDIIQQRLRRGGEDDLDVGLAGRLGIDPCAGRQRDILHPLGKVSGVVGFLAMFPAGCRPGIQAALTPATLIF